MIRFLFAGRRLRFRQRYFSRLSCRFRHFATPASLRFSRFAAALRYDSCRRHFLMAAALIDEFRDFQPFAENKMSVSQLSHFEGPDSLREATTPASRVFRGE